ncbi:hypothetical protein FRB94_013794 [Tulasnella sp. JGI-2019a]|nr:hypothetical protein FRB94_013794 [Tulasnella sp. JGI-2019a]KAG9010158.1 hypothetical protein FRB93_004820 [Tulasnella sp. JGI-2019a]KAG9035300.1 hypothetical protein FRB95_011595 [Tulasnella sp. JGI-2019a]
MPGDDRKRSRSPSDTESGNATKRHQSAQGVVNPANEQVQQAQKDNGEDVTMADATKNGNGATTDGAPSAAAAATQIHMRCLIVTQDASIIIGKAGSHVNEIREKSGAKVMVSESIPGNPERILNVSGALDAVSKAFGLIVRRINDEPFDVPSVPGSRAVTIKFIIPNSRMGSVIGRGGSKIKEIQEASGARLNASEGMLPGSTERVLSVSGVADAIHIATYYVGNILIEAGPPATGTSSYRPSSSRTSQPRSHPSSSSYPPPPQYYPPHHAAPYPATPQVPAQTQQIYIPNDLVGCIIGKGGAKINEIRSISGSTIRIMEPGATTGTGAAGAPAGAGPAPNERLVTVTGQPSQIQTAVQLLYHRLEQEKQKQMAGVQQRGAM